MFKPEESMDSNKSVGNIKTDERSNIKLNA